MTRYPPWDPKARLHLHTGCPYCWDDDPDVACDCPCHEEDREDEGDMEDEGISAASAAAPDVTTQALMRELAQAITEDEATTVYLSALTKAGVITEAEADEIRDGHGR